MLEFVVMLLELCIPRPPDFCVFRTFLGCVNFRSKFILILVIKKRMAVLLLMGVSGQFQCLHVL